MKEKSKPMGDMKKGKKTLPEALKDMKKKGK